MAREDPRRRKQTNPLKSEARECRWRVGTRGQEDPDRDPPRATAEGNPMSNAICDSLDYRTEELREQIRELELAIYRGIDMVTYICPTGQRVVNEIHCRLTNIGLALHKLEQDLRAGTFEPREGRR